MADVGHGQHVLQTDGLSANEVRTGFHTHVGHSLRSVFTDSFLQFLQVEISLEGIIALGNKAFLLYQLQHFASTTGHVCLGSGEVKVHDGHHTGLDKALGQDVLAGTSLMGRQYVVNAEHLLHGSFQAVEGFTAGIGIISHMHGCSLEVRHSIHSRIGEHIKIDIFVLQQESVITCLLYGTKAFLNGQKIKFLYYTHLVHFQGNLVLRLIKFYAHLLLINLIILFFFK